MASQLNRSSPLMTEPWAESSSGYGDPGLGSDGASQLPLMFADLWPLETAGSVYDAPPLHPFSDDLSPPLANEDMLVAAAAAAAPPPPLPACLDPFAWQWGGGALADGPMQPLWSDENDGGGFDMAPPPPPPPGVGPFHADRPAWQTAPRGGGYRAPQRTTPPTPHHPHHRRPAPPASRPLAAAAAPAVKRSHSGTPLTARRASSSATVTTPTDRPPAVVESGDALPGALQGLVAMEQGLRSANHEQQRLLSATYEHWDRRRSSASA